MFSLIYSWANSQDAGDLRRYRAHYDVTVKPNNIPVTRKQNANMFMDMAHIPPVYQIQV